MKKVLLLIVAVVLAVLCASSLKRHALLRDDQVDMAITLGHAYRDWTNEYQSPNLDAKAFGRLIGSNSVLKIQDAERQPKLTISTNSVLLGSHDILCIMEYRDQYVGIRGNGDRVFLNSDQFKFWKRESGAATVPLIVRSKDGTGKQDIPGS
jgi:hypothetical protein